MVYCCLDDGDMRFDYYHYYDDDQWMMVNETCAYDDQSTMIDAWIDGDDEDVFLCFDEQVGHPVFLVDDVFDDQ